MTNVIKGNFPKTYELYKCECGSTKWELHTNGAVRCVGCDYFNATFVVAIRPQEEQDAIMAKQPNDPDYKEPA